jgi:hypothetical protein
MQGAASGAVEKSTSASHTKKLTLPRYTVSMVAPASPATVFDLPESRYGIIKLAQIPIPNWCP